MTASAATERNATREKRCTAALSTVISAERRYSATSRAASPPSHSATASRWITSTGMAIPGCSPAEACSDSAQVAARPAATTTPPTARPNDRSRFSAPSSRRWYVPKRIATNSAATASSSSRQTSAAPVLLRNTWARRPMSATSPSFPEPMYAPRRSSSASVPTVRASQPPTTSRCSARTPAPRRQQISTKAAPPTSTVNPA